MAAPKPPFRIFHKNNLFHTSNRGLLLAKARVTPARGVHWYGGKTACHVVMDCGWEGWLPGGGAKRLKRVDAYERLRADPVGVLDAAAAIAPSELARAIGGACCVFSSYTYSHHPKVEGRKVSPSEKSVVLYSALSGGERLAIVKRIPAWMDCLMSDPELDRYSETLSNADCYLIATTAWARGVLPCSWSGAAVKEALWGALLMLLFDGEGLTLDDEAQRIMKDFAALSAGREYDHRQKNCELLLRYGKRRSRLRFASAWLDGMHNPAPDSGDLGLPPGLPVWS